MSDLVQRLRNDVSLLGGMDWQEHVALAREAADEIERLRQLLASAYWISRRGDRRDVVHKLLKDEANRRLGEKVDTSATDASEAEK